MFALIRKLLALPDRRNRILLAALLPAMLVTSVLELAGFGLLVSLLNALMGAAPIDAGFLNNLIRMARDGDPWVFAGIAVAFFGAKNLALLILWYFNHRIAYGAQATFLRRLYGLYLRAPYPMHLQRNSAEMLNHLLHSGPVAFDTIRILMEVVLELLLATATLGLLLAMEPVLALLGGAALFTVGFLFYHVTSPIFRRWGERAYGHEVEAVTLAKETLAAVKEVQVWGSQDHFTERYGHGLALRSRLLSLASTNLQSSRLFVETLMVIGIGGMLVWARETGQQAAEMASLVSMFGIAALRLMPSANRILSGLAEIRRRTTVIMMLYEELERDGFQESPPPPDKQVVTEASDASIALRDASFQYAGAKNPSLTEIALSIRPGEAVGLVGPSGAGKSTLIDLMLGLLHPTAGSVTVGGHSAHGACAAANGIGFVPQHVAILDDSIRRNIAFGLPDEAIDDGKVWQALTLASLADFVRALPDGLDTRLGEAGTRFSGGQRQRVGIARAVYRDPPILILDEATSALDGATEQEIVAAIEALRGTKTLIIIAHRLSTVRHCDRLVYLAEGRVVDVGTFDELEARQPQFRTMVDLSDVRGAARGVTAS